MAASKDSKYQAKIKTSDMSEDLAKDAVHIVCLATEKYTNEQEIALAIKKEFDKRHLAPWHCIVGKNFHSYVTHEEGSFIHVQKGPLQILLFKC